MSNPVPSLLLAAGVRAMGLATTVGCTVVGVYIAMTHLLGRDRLELFR